MRRPTASKSSASEEVSIHAPWEGCDPMRTFEFGAYPMFQFTHPGKGATTTLTKSNSNEYVSIHAPWEGCDDTSEESIRARSVSIHAPWEGCDKRILQEKGDAYAFQFTHPGKGATIAASAQTRARGVSIHAPWEGCDRAMAEGLHSSISFNSRTLGRVRLIRSVFLIVCREFQFTHPGKGATAQGRGRPS